MSQIFVRLWRAQVLLRKHHEALDFQWTSSDEEERQLLPEEVRSLQLRSLLSFYLCIPGAGARAHSTSVWAR